MAYVELLQIYLLPIKVFEVIMFLFTIHLLNYRFLRIPWFQRPLLNKLFVIGFWGWTVYIGLDIIIFIVAPLSMEHAPPYVFYDGYNLVYPSLLLANLLRDIAFAGALVMNWCFLLAAIDIRYGEYLTYQIFIRNYYTMGLITGISLFLIYGDKIEAMATDEGPIVKAQFRSISALSIAITIALYFISIYFLYRSLSAARKEDRSKDFTRRLDYLLMGTIFMGLGHVYWLVLGLVETYILTFPLSLKTEIILYYVGHFLWSLSPIFITLALYIPKNKKSKKQKEERDKS